MVDQVTELYDGGFTQQMRDANDIESLLCFSHLRWDFVFQRPQHLMTRAAASWRVFYVEEPVYSDAIPFPQMVVKEMAHPVNLFVVTPQFPHDIDHSKVNLQLQDMLAKLIFDFRIQNYGVWYYTPMALKFTVNLIPRVVVYDCMDELSAFRGAPPELIDLESELFLQADVIFTGGRSLYEAKQNRHSDIHAFPSSIDKKHFMQARQLMTEPDDQRDIPHPRMGFYGVVDERFDIELLRELSQNRPDWHFVIIGPVVKISHDILPQADNIHYLGMKTYDQLPVYLSGWDVALLLFALNESTRYISPTKTPEYLAAMKPVVSTPIHDVIIPYGELGLVSIAKNAQEFETAIAAALQNENVSEWQTQVDTFLQKNSWDITWDNMKGLIKKIIVEN